MAMLMELFLGGPPWPMAAWSMAAGSRGDGLGRDGAAAAACRRRDGARGLLGRIRMWERAGMQGSEVGVYYRLSRRVDAGSRRPGNSVERPPPWFAGAACAPADDGCRLPRELVSYNGAGAGLATDLAPRNARA